MVDQLMEAEAKSVAEWHAAGEVVLVDVREVSEYSYEHIAGSFLLPLSFLDTELFPILGKKIVIICQIGKRAAAAQKQLAEAGITDTVCLVGGIDAWREAELELEGTRYEEADYSI
ncbi:MAG: rhodanese-like domain-containing protein [Rhodospirillales bacterium]|nr:rhodanese-like domain-containing protein [Rhodospirillales bacterium]